MKAPIVRSLILGVLATTAGHAAEPRTRMDPPVAADMDAVVPPAGIPRERDTDALRVCDCLLPGKVRKVGRDARYVTKRRPIRTTVAECEIRGGEYVVFDRADLKTALRVWMESAEAGDAEAQNHVGEIFEKGLGVQPAHGVAAAWYRMAAEQGYAPAQINLGFLYEKGLGLDRDMERAIHWYRQAAGLGATVSLDPSGTGPVPAPSGVPVAGPTIELIEPAVVGRRGVEVVPASAPEREIVGRVLAPAGLLSFTINGAPAPVDERGLFRSVLAVPHPSVRCSLVAVDAAGNRSEVLFELSRSAIGLARRTVEPIEGEFGPFVALVIGNDRYESFPDLRTAVGDAQRVAALLEGKYGFRTRTLVDASRYAILSALNEMRESAGEDVNLVVYYAGHGQRIEAIERGYWLPVDAEPDNPATWISTADISDYLRIIPARHILVIADACFAGTLTRSAVARPVSTATAEERSHWYRAVRDKRARLALASGGLTPVLDGGGGGHSVFNEALVRVLEANADVLEASRLYHEVAARVAFAATELGAVQEPEFAPVRFAGHESGDFLFVPEVP